MKKQQILIMVLIVIAIPIFIAFMMNLSIFDNISGSNDGWLGFWGGYLGAIVAIGGVYWQIEEQRNEFQSNKIAKAKVAIGLTSVTIENKETHMFTTKEGFVEIWATNAGYMAGSFMFIGITDEHTYNRLEIETDESKRDELLQHVLELDFDYTKMGRKKREFQFLNPNEVSERVIYSFDSIMTNFKDDNNVYAIYMDPLGRTYGAGLNIREKNSSKDEGTNDNSKK